MAEHHLMLEEACCVPLGDVQRYRREDTQTLPCLERSGKPATDWSVVSICYIVTASTLLWMLLPSIGPAPIRRHAHGEEAQSPVSHK